ncbi:MAG: hypothetical protein LBQ51_00300 [Desulfovibrio sp.]|nr:hypothetical protein [Desulfovibrio sp.]
MFTAFLAMSANRETPLSVLFAEATRLADPFCDEEKVRLAVLRYEQYLANPPLGEDAFGNPLWISLPPSAAHGSTAVRAAGHDQGRNRDASEGEEFSAPEPKKKNFFQGFFSRSESAEQEIVKTVLARRSSRNTGQNGIPASRLARFLLFGAIFAVLYYFFIKG